MTARSKGKPRPAPKPAPPPSRLDLALRDLATEVARRELPEDTELHFRVDAKGNVHALGTLPVPDQHRLAALPRYADAEAFMEAFHSGADLGLPPIWLARLVIPPPT